MPTDPCTKSPGIAAIPDPESLHPCCRRARPPFRLTYRLSVCRTLQSAIATVAPALAPMAILPLVYSIDGPSDSVHRFTLKSV
jgi:hypothetical protein